MELTFSCPQCQVVNHLPRVEQSRELVCKSCGAEREIHADAIECGGLQGCPCCGTTELYIQKDFPQGLGLFIVVVGFAISTVFWYLERPIYTYLILLVSALIDMVLYYRVPDVTICYRCLSQVRGEGSNGGGRFHPFDLAIGERYRQERIRAEELRRAGRTAEKPSPASDDALHHA